MKYLPIITFALTVVVFVCLFDNKSKYEEDFDEVKQVHNEDNENIIKKINKNRCLIKNIKADLYYTQNISLRINISTYGLLAYEKDNDFRLILNSTFNKEFDMGSNSDGFWYWSRRSIDRSLFFSTYENINKTRLKDPLNPLVIKKNLCLDEFPEGSLLYQSENFYIIKSKLTSINTNENMIYECKLNKNDLSTISTSLMDQNDKLIFKSKTLSNYDVDGHKLPKTISIFWPDEKMNITWNLKNIQINTKLNKALWKMPNHKNKIDIGKD